MANEITFNLVFSVSNTGYSDSWNEQDQWTQNAIGAVGGVASVLTSMTILDLGSVTTLGFCVMKNLDTTNSVDFGINNSGTFVGVGTLNAGEVPVLRWKAGVIPALKAVTATTQVQYLLLQN